MSAVEEPFAPVLAVGGRSNSLGRVDDVVTAAVADPARLPELYDCLAETDAWVRMRAADALEKVCRRHPEWFGPYVDRLLEEYADHDQASIQWHLAQVVGHVELTDAQARAATAWLSRMLARDDLDWIVAAHAMQTLVGLAASGNLPRAELVGLLQVQLGHRSRSVVRKAEKLLAAVADDGRPGGPDAD